MWDRLVIVLCISTCVYIYPPPLVACTPGVCRALYTHSIYSTYIQLYKNEYAAEHSNHKVKIFINFPKLNNRFLKSQQNMTFLVQISE